MVCEQRTISVDNSCPDSRGASRAGAVDHGRARGSAHRTAPRETAPFARAHPPRFAASSRGANGPVKAASVCVYETVDEPAGIEQLRAGGEVELYRSASASSSPGPQPHLPGRPTATAPARSSRRACTWSPRCCRASGSPSRSSRNGRAVGFRGRIPGPDADGRAVDHAGEGRQEVAEHSSSLQTDANGHFKRQVPLHPDPRPGAATSSGRRSRSRVATPTAPGASPKRKRRRPRLGRSRGPAPFGTGRKVISAQTRIPPTSPA